MSNVAEKIINDIINYVKSEKGKKTIGGFVIGAAFGAGGAAGYTYWKTKKEDEKIIREEKNKSYKKGLHDGIEISFEQIGLNVIAEVATLYYLARADGHVKTAEKELIEKRLSCIATFAERQALSSQINEVANYEDMGFEFVEVFFEKIDDAHLCLIIESAKSFVKSSEMDSNESQKRINKLVNYASKRLDSNGAASSSYYGVPLNKINEKVMAYDKKMQELEAEFMKKTQLNKTEIGLIMLAVAMHCFRIKLINRWSQIEKAGKGEREKELHKKQEEMLGLFKNEEDCELSEYYAPLQQIILTPGVPYDTTLLEGPKVDIFNASERGKGANHRFSTLGHDPIIGLLVGTINIMTNTITTTREDNPFPVTYHVKYHSKANNQGVLSYKKPAIVTKPNASFIIAMECAVERSKEDIKPLVASVIKQVIHIATDLYTPAGIQLPGANLVMTRENAEVLTSYISAGDIVKYTNSSGLEWLIDQIILALHGCLIMEQEGTLDEKIHLAKAKKIILYSKGIIQSSNILEAALKCSADSLDWAGFSTFMKEYFSDVKFIFDLQHEFISVGLGEDTQKASKNEDTRLSDGFTLREHEIISKQKFAKIIKMERVKIKGVEGILVWDALLWNEISFLNMQTLKTESLFKDGNKDKTEQKFKKLYSQYRSAKR